MSKDSRDLLVGLDIGTSKVVALVAELSPDGEFNVLGLGQTSSKGLKKGVVVNIEATVQSIQKALEEAELMSDRRIAQVYTGIAGNHIVSFNSSGMVAIRDKDDRPCHLFQGPHQSNGRQSFRTFPSCQGHSDP